jgi:hypothetical protein
VRVGETSGGHAVVPFCPADGTQSADMPACLAALDGAEVGDSGEVVVELTPGRDVRGCVTRGHDAHGTRRPARRGC